MTLKSIAPDLWQRREWRPGRAALRISACRWAIGASLALAMLGAAHAPRAVAAEGTPRVVIGVSPEGASCLLGGAINGEIVSASTVAPMMSHAQEYTLVQVAGTGSMTAAIGTPLEVEPEADCEDQYDQELALLPEDLGRLQTAVLGSADAVAGDLAQTRILDSDEIEKLKLDIRVYLDESGFLYTGVEISQAIEFDANNDDVSDMLINAINSRRENAQRGEYALIVLKDGASGTFTIVTEEFTEETSDYPSLLWENTVVAILDIDGDRNMELVVYGTFYYGDGWEVFKIGADGGSAVLGCGCGG